jgi:chemotaxis protein MotB
MRKKKGEHAGGHGWFVTFADLMALLLSFFVMLVAFSTQDKQKLQLVAGSMRDAFGTTRDSYYAGIIEIMGIPVRPRLKMQWMAHRKMLPRKLLHLRKRRQSKGVT